MDHFSEDIVMGLCGSLTSRDVTRLRAVMEFAGEYYSSIEHPLQVTRLSLRLFDELKPLHYQHQDSNKSRFLLQCGALLHDIGWVGGQSQHHKRSARLILQSEIPFSRREKLMIALLARYHRKALPDPIHDGYASLDAPHQQAIDYLAGILRLADSLDISHNNLVADLTCSFTPPYLIVECYSSQQAMGEIEAASKKGVLLEQILERKLQLNWNLKTT